MIRTNVRKKILERLHGHGLHYPVFSPMILYMSNEYTISVRETASTYVVTITFAEPFLVGDRLANHYAGQRILHFLQMNKVRFAKRTKAWRSSECEFYMKITK